MRILDDIKEEFKGQAYTGITAGLALLVGLSWREPIAATLNRFLAKFGIAGNGYMTAVVTTLVATLLIYWTTKWLHTNKKKRKKLVRRKVKRKKTITKRKK
jgi:high-affinity Fe2+/Pb2+ permease